MPHHLNGRPLHARKDPRKVSGGRSPYVYRREAGVHTGFGGHHRFPTLYVSKKIQDKPGLTFFNCPHFKALRGSEKEEESGSMFSGKPLTTKELEKTVKEIDEKNKKVKQKRKAHKDPSLKEVRKHLEKIVKYHAKKVHDSVPSIYPILGPVNSDDDDEENDDKSKRGGDKRLNTKQEFKKY